MSHKVVVGDSLQFVGESATKDNIKGNPSTERMSSVDWFDQTALDVTYGYTQTLGGTNDLGALCAAGEHGFKGTCGDTDDQVAFLATGLIFDITQKPEIEAKIEITDVSGTTVFFGFSDSTSDTTPEAIIDAAGGTLAAGSGVADAVGFVIDADLGSSSLWCASENTSAAIQSVDTAIDWTDTQSKVLRVKLDASGNAYFYVDGVQKGYIALAVADVPLCAVLDYGQRAATANTTVYMRYLKKWADVP